jgi:aconitate hydratase
VVTAYFEKAGLTPYLDQLGFNLAGYGCTTCIGNSGPLPPEISEEIQRKGLVAASVLSGNRNFEGRINPEVRANFLMSPPLVVAFALKGRMDWDPQNEAIGQSRDGRPVYLKDIWPSPQEVAEALKVIESKMFRQAYGDIFEGDHRWKSMPLPSGNRYQWSRDSFYVRQPPYFENMSAEPPESVEDISGARALALLGDSITTDHISPAGSIKKDSPAGRYLLQHGIDAQDFNSYGSRRGNHEVMVRGTFANTRIRNRLAPSTEGGWTTHFPTSKVMSIFDAAELYQKDGIPLCILAGKEYGSGSSRDWAAKGPLLQGIKFVLAESFERIHRSNLVGMGILPLQFLEGDNINSLGLSGEETFEIRGLKPAVDSRFADGREVTVQARTTDGSVSEFQALIRIDTPQELLYYLNGGILQYVLRQLLSGKQRAEAISVGTKTTGQPDPACDPKDEAVDEGSEESFPASDPPAY